MKKISLKNEHQFRRPTIELMIAVNLILTLALLRVGAAEIAALAVLFRELRRWNRRAC
jgi:hypothetical protein